jgi:NADPH-dependent 2,4-dienoyl-CoA reductase/sulfur reductase-like enzyme/nitrite reductase/ring-hydroxylating ferredoxin subunit
MAMKEIVLARIDELQDGEMKAFSVGDDKILLSKIAGVFYAVGGLCPHYGAPLDEGILHDGIVVCPWHHAFYDAKTGDVIEPPSLDSLPRYEVIIQGQNVVVKLPEVIPDRRVLIAKKQDLRADKRTFVIVGAGGAGNAAAQTLREDDFKGRIVMITRENQAPYDRPMLSKDYMEGAAGEELVPLRSETFYKDNDIELMLQREVKLVDILKKLITFDNGENLAYDAVLLASGGVPKPFMVPGVELKNIFTLRSFEDSNKILESARTASHVGIIGSGFIGMETAHSLTKRKLSVTVIAPEDTPFQNVLGKKIGQMFRQLHEKAGVRFKMGAKVAKFEGSKNVQTIVLESGERIGADLVIVGTGVRPATDFLNGIDLLPDGSLTVDRFLCAAENVYAAGDIATFPLPHREEKVRIEHWRTALQQGRVAGHNMAGKKTAYTSIPFFWTNQAGLYFRYVGHASEWDEIIIHGDIASQDFIAYYVKNNKVHAAAGNNREKEMAVIEVLMQLNRMPSAQELKEGKVDLVALLKQR